MNRKVRLSSRLADLFYLIFAILLSGFALRGFLIPNRFVDGGMTGVSLLFQEGYHINVGYLVVPFNLPFIYMGWRLVGRSFAIKTLMCIIGVSLCVLLVPFPTLTQDKLLVAIFGGVLLGLGMGLGMRGGAALDGVEVLALYTGRRIAFTTSEIILALNVVIFVAVGIMVGLEAALYSTMTYYAASRTTNFVVEGLEEYTSVTIVSGKSEEIRRCLVLDLGRGVTVYKGERGFLRDSYEVSHPADIIFTVITRLEVRRVKNMVHGIDPKAFIVTASAKEAVGGVLSRHASH